MKQEERLLRDVSFDSTGLCRFATIGTGSLHFAVR